MKNAVMTATWSCFIVDQIQPTYVDDPSFQIKSRMVLQQLAPQVRMLMGRAFRSGLVAVVAFSYFPKDGAKAV